MIYIAILFLCLLIIENKNKIIEHFFEKTIDKEYMFVYNALTKQNIVRINRRYTIMIIINKKKFTRSMLTLIIGLVIILLYFTNISFSKTELETKTIFVSTGDTLWEIAENEQINNRYYEGKKVQEIIYDIRNTNNLADSYLYEGQKLEILSYKK